MSGTDVAAPNNDQPVGIVGLSGSGVPTTPVNATGNGEMTTADILNGAINAKTITLSTTPTLVAIGSSNVANRKMIMIQAKSANVVYGYGPTLAACIFTLANTGIFTQACGANVNVYVAVTGGSGSAAIAEGA